MPEVAGAACATTPVQRVARGTLSVLTAALAYTAGTSGRLWCAVPAAVCAAFLAVGAATGWCPTNLLPWRRTAAAGSTTHGYPDARHLVRLSVRTSREGIGR